MATGKRESVEDDLMEFIAATSSPFPGMASAHDDSEGSNAAAAEERPRGKTPTHWSHRECEVLFGMLCPRFSEYKAKLLGAGKETKAPKQLLFADIMVALAELGGLEPKSEKQIDDKVRNTVSIVKARVLNEMKRPEGGSAKRSGELPDYLLPLEALLRSEFSGSDFSPASDLAGSAWIASGEIYADASCDLTEDQKPTLFDNMTADVRSPFSLLCAAAGVPPFLVLLGGGNLATALVQGAVRSGFVAQHEVVITARSDATVLKWMERGYTNVMKDNAECLRRFPGIVFVAVKPQMRKDLFSQISDGCLSAVPVLVSLMAAVDLQTLRRELPPLHRSVSLCRLHPNTAASVGAGTAIISAEPLADQKRISIVSEFARCVGTCLPVDERTFNAAGVLAGCVPAWTFTVIEALSDGAVLSGCPRGTATQLAAQALMGAAKMVLESGVHPAELKDQVCSPAGTTISGLRELERTGVRSAFIEAVKAATDRSNSM